MNDTLPIATNEQANALTLLDNCLKADPNFQGMMTVNAWKDAFALGVIDKNGGLLVTKPK